MSHVLTLEAEAEVLKKWDTNPMVKPRIAKVTVNVSV